MNEKFETKIELKVLLGSKSKSEDIQLTLDFILFEQGKEKFQIGKLSDYVIKQDLLLGQQMSVLLSCPFQIISPEFISILNLLTETLKPMSVYFFVTIGRFSKSHENYELMNKAVHIYKIGWGNYYYPGTFIDHYNVTELWSKEYINDNIEFRRLYENNCGNISPIFADFYHDRQYMEIYFAIPMCNQDCTIEQRKQSVAKIVLYYNKIIKMSINDIREDKKESGMYIASLYFWTMNPVSVYYYQYVVAKIGEKERKFWEYKQTRSFIDENSSYVKEAIHESSIFYIQLRLSSNDLMNLIERFKSLTSKEVEFTNWRLLTFDRNFYVEKPFQNKECKKKIDNQSDFSLSYLIDAVFSRGFNIKDQLLTSSKRRDDFLDMILKFYQENRKVTLLSLESFINKLDESIVVGDILNIFEWVYNNESKNVEITDAIKEHEKKEHYVYVRKIVITPTRKIYRPPELMMHNRMLRQFDPNGKKTLRILFRDDNKRPIKEVRNEYIIEQVLNDCLDNGLNVGGQLYNFLGSSNSQMRDGGCYFYRGTTDEIIELRKNFGFIKQEVVPKMIARIGQCFTQALIAEKAIVQENRMLRDPDYETPRWIGSNEKVGCYSDGCGMISYNMAENIFKSLNIFNLVSSCYQFRFRGYKGVLSVCPHLDKSNKLAEKNKINLIGFARKNNSILKHEFAVDSVFRFSQLKFKGNSEDRHLEIVKSSQPSLLSLNRPLLNVMDQVSKRQSYKCNKRICNRVHELFDVHVSSIRKCLLTERGAFEILSSMPIKCFGVNQLNNPKVVSFQVEPFFKSMINSYALFQVQKVLKKLKIQIPCNMGRTMFGIIDETGILEYGQVFVQYHENMNVMTNMNDINTKKIIHKGKVMITKNPTVVSGDVRIFEAVDVPELHDMVDVVIFPRDGPRPHSDEMAGSDLDGDEYSVFFDESLFIDYNMPAFDFDAGKSVKDVKVGVKDENELDIRMKEFIKDFLKTESIGTLASSHLMQSDFFGLDSEVCVKIAIKHNKALDFAKTGEFPEQLTTRWEGNVPPETPKVVADIFEYRALKKPSYESSRLIGELFRRLHNLETLLSTSSSNFENDIQKKNPLFDITNWNEQYTLATKFYYRYAAAITSLQDTYGIDNEAELFSGFRLNVRNKITDNDDDDMSYFNTDLVIRRKLKLILYNFKIEILKNFGDIDKFFNDLPKEESNERIEIVLEQPLAIYPETLKKFVIAAYHVSYDMVKCGAFNIYSFPWIFWDVLKKVGSLNLVRMENKQFITSKYFDSLLTNHINEYILSDTKKDSFEKFCHELKNNQQLKECYRYVKRYINLDKLLYFLLEWAKEWNIIPKVNKHLLIVLFIQLLCGYYNINSIESYNFIDKISELTNEELMTPIDINSIHGGSGRFCLDILSFLSSYQFKNLNHIFGWDMEMGCEYALLNFEWISIYNAAVETINNLAFSHTFDALPQIIKKVCKYQSFPPMTVYLPKEVSICALTIFEKIKRISGLKKIHHRKNENSYKSIKNVTEWVLTPIGTYESYIKFKGIVRPVIPTSINIIHEIDLAHYIAMKFFAKVNNVSIFNS
ncbi:RNA-dependent RNA polymerase, eukaryotic-type family-containing protein [Strongyloides ratti]|uniref:RNA-directed RNA polymerase n=1 Tax=Strongyloides ratti TaxID=34506 RepID=A0A090L781_STRRB|nr:RNA-dependent RNA polymerase, eukaryotic-type family-containing protein [Strongyloides ratti]CEF65587.1 RNA-dependent RNA polymerase, eukaryotic-type family-containing protein [Strongyloides ratti]